MKSNIKRIANFMVEWLITSAIYFVSMSVVGALILFVLDFIFLGNLTYPSVMINSFFRTTLVISLIWGFLTIRDYNE